jgi:hypothetical protein
MGSWMQYVQSGSKKLLFGFKWVPHIIQIEKLDVLLGTFDAKRRCVDCFIFPIGVLLCF